MNLADPLFWPPQKIEILIGAEHFYELICERQVKPTADGPIFQETRLGWIVSGSLPVCNRNTEPPDNIACHFTSTCSDINMTVESVVYLRVYAGIRRGVYPTTSLLI